MSNRDNGYMTNNNHIIKSLKISWQYAPRWWCSPASATRCTPPPPSGASGSSRKLMRAIISYLLKLQCSGSEFPPSSTEGAKPSSFWSGHKNSDTNLAGKKTTSFFLQGPDPDSNFIATDPQHRWSFFSSIIHFLVNKVMENLRAGK